MTTERPPTIDPAAAARWEKIAPLISPWLHEEVARRMEQRLDWIRRRPNRWAHWSPTLGGLSGHDLVARRYPDAECFVVEAPGPRRDAAVRSLHSRWWQPARWRSPTPRFAPPPPGSVQMLWSNMALHLAADPQQLIEHWHRALDDDGFLMFSCLGPDSLRELRAVYRTLGWGEPCHAFTDMHDWGDMLLHAGFAEPVMDMERITLTYTSARALLAELRGLGRNLHSDRFPGLRTPRWRERLERELQRGLPEPADDSRLALTFEIVYGHAFKAPPRAKDAGSVGTTIPLADVQRQLRQRGKELPAAKTTGSAATG